VGWTALGLKPGKGMTFSLLQNIHIHLGIPSLLFMGYQGAFKNGKTVRV